MSFTFSKISASSILVSAVNFLVQVKLALNPRPLSNFFVCRETCHMKLLVFECGGAQGFSSQTSLSDLFMRIEAAKKRSPLSTKL